MNIPASQLVSVIPGVLGAGGNPLSLNAVFLTNDASVPIGTVAAFATLQDVKDFFGSTSPEADAAAIYFSGFAGATRVPGLLYFAQFNVANVAAYLRSASLDGVTLTDLQALNGTVIVVVDGETITSSAINLAAASSFSNAAALIQAGLQANGTIFQGTATISNGSGGSGAILNVSAVASGVLHVGDAIVGSTTPCVVVSQESGAPGGIGLYTVSVAQDFDPGGTIYVNGAATVAYDSTLNAFVVSSPTTGATSTIGFATGTISDELRLQAAQGAVLSQGAAAGDAETFMDGVTEVTQNFGTFLTLWEPNLATKLEFAAWVQTTNSRYAYVAWDTDVAAITPDAAGTFGALVNAGDYVGVVPVYDTVDLAAFVCGTAAAIDFQQPNGRITFAFKSQPGLTANVVDATVAVNLIGNGYNFYGSYATANEQFSFLQPGQISGSWNWIDPYVNQIYLNSEFQLAYMTALAGFNSIPYNDTGYAILRNVAMDPINAALSFGSIRPGVVLSAAQAVQVNTAAGVKISDTLNTAGWYLQIVPATAEQRVLRESPPMTFWYMDGGSIQKIELASIDVQ